MLIVLLVLLLVFGGSGVWVHRTGWGGENPVVLVLVVMLVLMVFGGLGGHYYGGW